MARKREFNEYKVCGDMTIFYVHYKSEVYEVLIDTEDLDLVLNHYGKMGLKFDKTRLAAVRFHKLGEKGTALVKLHRVIMDAPSNTVVDHINGNVLDNRKHNLRITTVLVNTRNRRKHINNTSGYPGVRPTENGKKWVARIGVKDADALTTKIKHNGKSRSIGKRKTNEVYLGTFLTLEDAIKARKDAEKKYWGEDR